MKTSFARRREITHNQIARKAKSDKLSIGRRLADLPVNGAAKQRAKLTLLLGDDVSVTKKKK